MAADGYYEAKTSTFEGRLVAAMTASSPWQSSSSSPLISPVIPSPQFKTTQEAKKFLEQHHVSLVLAQFVDIHGVAKTKAVPTAHFDDILTEGAGFAGFALWGFGMQPHDPDYMARGELNTLSLVPWQPGYARIICTGHV